MTSTSRCSNLDGLGVLRARREERAPGSSSSASRPASEQYSRRWRRRGRARAQKPTALATDRLYEMSSQLVAAVRAAAAARHVRQETSPTKSQPLAVPSAPTKRLVVIGRPSGPQRFQVVKGSPPVSGADQSCSTCPPGTRDPTSAPRQRLRCHRSASSWTRMLLEVGTALIARAGYHLKVRERGGRFVATTDLHPVDTPPGKDGGLLARRGGGGATLGIVLTGMGDDASPARGPSGPRAARSRRRPNRAVSSTACRAPCGRRGSRQPRRRCRGWQRR